MRNIHIEVFDENNIAFIYGFKMNYPSIHKNIPFILEKLREIRKYLFSIKRRKKTMEQLLKELIEKYKAGDKMAMSMIISKMTPIINKYARKLFKMEFEDMRQEMIIAVIESVMKIKKYDSEYECLRYITNGVHYRYMELIRKSITLEYCEEITDYEKLGQFSDPHFSTYSDIEFFCDLEKKCDISSNMKKKIYDYVINCNYNDNEIARDLKVSRQYVNRCKKRIFCSLIEK